MGEDGCTPYERIKGKRSSRPVVELGERVWYVPLDGRKKKPNDVERVRLGTLLGARDKSNEIIVGDALAFLDLSQPRLSPEFFRSFGARR